MAWWITNGILQKANKAPAANSILTDITGEGNVVIPEGVTSIGKRAFSRCDSLTSINIPEGVTSIGNEAFFSCDSLTSINIPNSVTSIGDSAFYSCSSLTSITIPNSVTSIGNQAFRECKSLTSIILNISDAEKDVSKVIESLWNMGRRFTDIRISDNSSFRLENDVLISDKGVLNWAKRDVTDIVIPEGVTSIGNQAFRWCSSLTSITIPNSVTSIGDSAFKYCDSLTSINIPNSVTSIGDNAFSGCKSLTIPTGLFAQLDKETLKSVQAIACPISLKDAPAELSGDEQKGKLVVHYQNAEDLQRIWELLESMKN